MGIEQIETLTTEIYNKYKDDDGFIHNIYYAVSCCDEHGHLKYKKAMTKYTPANREFIVNDEQIKTGKEEYNRRKQQELNNIKVNELIFVGMGMDFKPVNNEHIGNHRIRTYFKDNDGILCFVEFGTAVNKEFIRCDHALFNTEKENTRTIKEQDETEKRVYLLEGLRSGNIEYTKNNILKLVNKNFNTDFKDVRVYSYFINTEDYNNISQKTQ